MVRGTDLLENPGRAAIRLRQITLPEIGRKRDVFAVLAGSEWNLLGINMVFDLLKQDHGPIVITYKPEEG